MVAYGVRCMFVTHIFPGSPSSVSCNKRSRRSSGLATDNSFETTPPFSASEGDSDNIETTARPQDIWARGRSSPNQPGQTFVFAATIIKQQILVRLDSCCRRAISCPSALMSIIEDFAVGVELCWPVDP